MATKKIASNKVFLNPWDTTCLAVVGWSVEVWYDEDKTRRTMGKTAHIDAVFNISEEGRTHHVYRQGHLRPIRRARVELNKFEQAVEQAMEWIQDNDLKLEK
jgi:hypothetical protein